MVFSFQLPLPLLPPGVVSTPDWIQRRTRNSPASPHPRASDWPSSQFIPANANWEIYKAEIKLQKRKQICDFFNLKKNWISEENGDFSQELLCDWSSLALITTVTDLLRESPFLLLHSGLKRPVKPLCPQQ